MGSGGRRGKQASSGEGRGRRVRGSRQAKSSGEERGASERLRGWFHRPGKADSGWEGRMVGVRALGG